ncbi:hypothetical protein Nepgr_023937 [Nepenthes gracilis]|uniref:Uncharacterized protein n=1 Tax=Nepenthes gracilis TaxID=150966 RepID=A0AAD3XZK3_NEPGR|nr:hypothetical protein Nepgr_023937 [Nepenthes gracilis]
MAVNPKYPSFPTTESTRLQRTNNRDLSANVMPENYTAKTTSMQPDNKGAAGKLKFPTGTASKYRSVQTSGIANVANMHPRQSTDGGLPSYIGCGFAMPLNHTVGDARAGSALIPGGAHVEMQSGALLLFDVCCYLGVWHPTDEALWACKMSDASAGLRLIATL